MLDKIAQARNILLGDDDHEVHLIELDFLGSPLRLSKEDFVKSTTLLTQKLTKFIQDIVN